MENGQLVKERKEVKKADALYARYAYYLLTGEKCKDLTSVRRRLTDKHNISKTAVTSSGVPVSEMVTLYKRLCEQKMEWVIMHDEKGIYRGKSYANIRQLLTRVKIKQGVLVRELALNGGDVEAAIKSINRVDYFTPVKPFIRGHEFNSIGSMSAHYSIDPFQYEKERRACSSDLEAYKRAKEMSRIDERILSITEFTNGVEHFDDALDYILENGLTLHEFKQEVLEMYDALYLKTLTEQNSRNFMEEVLV